VNQVRALSGCDDLIAALASSKLALLADIKELAAERDAYRDVARTAIHHCAALTREVARLESRLRAERRKLSDRQDAA
jgi:hypothetical protein